MAAKIPKAPIDDAIEATKGADYLRGLTLFLEIYGTEAMPPIRGPKAAAGLSYFAVCLALVQRKFKAATELARHAIDLEFYNGDHYANLARIYLAAGKRKKAVDSAESGLKIAPENDMLIQVRKDIGVRARPPVPFLDRTNPVNVTLGQALHAKRLAEREKEREIKKSKKK